MQMPRTAVAHLFKLGVQLVQQLAHGMLLLLLC